MVHILMAMLMLMLGYLVKYQQWSWLIAGYNTSTKQEKEKYDQAALCNGVGNFLFILAGLLFIAALGDFMDTAWVVAMGWILFTAAVAVFLVYANTGGRFKSRE